MLGLAARILGWNLSRSRGRTLIMVITVFCALSSYVLLGTALAEMAENVAGSLRSDWPFDVIAAGKIDVEQVFSARSLAGVSHVEALCMHEVFLGSGLQSVVTLPSTETALVMELDSGRLPSEAEEIVLPALLADALRLTVDDGVKLVGQRPGDIPQSFRVVGILSGKAKVLTKPVLALEGMDRLLPGQGGVNHMLIQLDGQVDLDSFSRQLHHVVPNAEIVLSRDEYAEAQQSRSMSDSLVIGLRGLILAITAASLGVLFYLTQRDGAYQTGVLRATGVQRAWLLLPAILLTLLVFAIGILLTAWLLPLVAARLGLLSGRAILLASLHQDSATYLLVGLASTLVVNWQFLSLPVPKLLKDAW